MGKDLALCGVLIGALAGLLTACAAPAPDGSGEDFAPALERYVADVMERFSVPGMTVAVTRGDEMVYAGAFGVTNLQTLEPMRPEHIFHMASVSKPFVATAIMQLVEAGRIDLDEPVVTYLPYFALDDERSSQITVRQMLNHTSGMPDVEDYEWDRPQYDDGAAERYVRSLASEKMIAAPGELCRYSNMAFDTLGDVIAKVSGRIFEDFVDEGILDPLGMVESSFLRTEIAEQLRTTPHVWRLGPVVSEIYPYNRPHAPSSTLNSSVVEMTRWAIANLNRGELDGVRILSERSYDELWTPSARISDTSQIGLSWFIGEHRGLQTISHGGGDTGYRTFLVLVPEPDLGLVIAANYDLTPMAELSKGLLDVVLGYQPEMPRRWIALTFAETYLSGGLEAAKSRYRELRTSAANDYDFSPEQLVYLAYMMMQNEQPQVAIDALRFNVELFPEHVASYDYLARAYLETGDRVSAADAYRRILELDPDDENARRMIGDLDASSSSRR